MDCIPTTLREVPGLSGHLPSAAVESEFKAPLERLLAAVVTLSGASAAVVRLLEDERHELRMVGAVALPESVRCGQARVGDGCGVCGDALRDDEPRCLPQSCACVRGLESGRKRERAAPAQQVAVFPLHHRGTTCGVLNLFLPLGRALDDTLLPLLQPLGDMLGLALENARLTRQYLRASVEEERHMLANEVHDSLAQNLSGMRMRTALLRDAVRARDEARAFKYLGEMDEALAVAHRRVRELITHFRSQVDPRGLVHAIDEAVRTFQGLGGLRLEFDACAEDLPLSAEQQMQVFHIVHEALANMVKHARAQRGRLRLEPAGADAWRITVEDDGVGLAGPAGTGPEHGHFGLNIMRERARRIGGKLDFKSAKGRGTRVELRFPARWPEVEVAA